MDAAHVWGGDLAVGLDGDLLLSDGADEVRERVLRRLLTNPTEYRWHLEYGAGLPAWVGEAVDAGRIASLVREQMGLDEAVARTPEPDIRVTVGDDNVVVLDVTYAEALTGATRSLVFGIS